MPQRRRAVANRPQSRHSPLVRLRNYNHFGRCGTREPHVAPGVMALDVTSKIYFPRSVADQTLLTPTQAGRRITGGLSVLNRAGRGAFSKIWVPRSVAENQALAANHQFEAEWVAVREVDIARQYGNHMIYDMKTDAGNQLKWTHFDHSRMTDDGYRLVVVTMGVYEKPAVRGDEWQIFDQELRERVQQIANIMWDVERGGLIGDALTRQLWFKGWNDQRVAPDIGLSLAGLDLFYNTKAWRTPSPTKRLNFQLTKKFLEIVGALRQDNFDSDQVLFGIHIPEFHKSNQWIYLAEGEHKIWEFNSLISSIYRGFDMWSVGGAGVQPTVMHLPTYRHRQRVRGEIRR
mgnify:CR=1 FL=1